MVSFEQKEISEILARRILAPLVRPAKMVLNFCLPQFKPRIHCNKISADGYEVENLISEDLTRRHRGFRSEYFIKPPVHITLTFPFNIEIYRINIDISVGGLQYSTGLDVYTSTSSNKVFWNSIESQISPSACQAFSDKDVFTLVGKVLLKNQSRVSFSHRGFKPRPPFHQTESVFSYPDSLAQELWNKGPFSLSSVTHLKLVILHVTGGGLPCIKKLEVWGQPAKSCPQEVIDGLLQISCESMNPDFGLQNPVLPTESDYMANNSADNLQQNHRELNDIIWDVPEEFLDPITLEMMTFPILLPSGKVIDQSTLEKCNQSEAAWGRMPSDPFTGVAYSQHSQPLPHPSLKARIDSFLLQNRIPGTNILGRAQTGAVLTPSTIAVSSLKRKIDCIEPTMNDKNVEPPYFSARNYLFTSASEECAKKMKIITEVNVAQMDCSAGPVSHEQRLSESLDIALNSTLGCRPSFTTKLGKSEQLYKGCDGSSSWSASTVLEQSRSATTQGCASCSRTFSPYFKTEPIYQLPCGHIMCRPCIAEKQKLSSILCMNCKRSVATRDVVRVHL